MSSSHDSSYDASLSTIGTLTDNDESDELCGVFLPRLDSDRFQLTRRLERGGTGIVYEAKDLKLPRDVAVKVLRNRYAQSKSMLSHFAYEAAIMSFLAHPGVIPIYDSGECSDGRPFHAMKLIKGDSLSNLLRRPESPRRPELVRTFMSICQTVAFAHEQGVIHLDLKPSNILIGAFGNVLVTDWGLSRFISKAPDSVISFVPEFPDTTHIEGTPGYMAPEQARADSVDQRTDVFGLGAILCEILTGRPPYQNNSSVQILKDAANAKLDDAFASLERCDADDWLIQLAKDCLSAIPDQRPTTAIEVADEVAGYQASALEQAENDLTRFFDLSLDLFCLANFEGYFRRINSNFTRVLGYSERDLMSEPFISFVHPDDREKTVRQMSVLSEGQPVARFRNRYRKADGGFVVMEWTAKAIAGENVIFAVARDVTCEVYDAS